MKEKDNIKELFERLQNEFDFESPESGHKQRFLEKLNQKNTGKNSDNKSVVSLNQRKRNWLKPMSIAASLILIAVLGFQFFSNQPTIEEQMVEISPEASKTEFYFASLIEEQVQQLKDQKSPATAKLVDDTLAQLNKLENDHKKLEKELLNGGNSKIILNAMIINFQTRIDLLQEVLNNIEDIKNLKINDDANFTI